MSGIVVQLPLGPEYDEGLFPAKRKAGRATKWRPEYVEMARSGRRRDCTLEELAESFGVHVSTICEWMKKYPEFSEAIKESRVKADAEVDNARHMMCTGFHFEEEILAKVKDENGIKVNDLVRVRRYQPPNAAMIKFTLINRSRVAQGLKPEVWHDKVRNELTGEDGGPIQVERGYSQVSDEMARKLIAQAEGLAESEGE